MPVYFGTHVCWAIAPAVNESRHGGAFNFLICSNVLHIPTDVRMAFATHGQYLVEDTSTARFPDLLRVLADRSMGCRPPSRDVPERSCNVPFADHADPRIPRPFGAACSPQGIRVRRRTILRADRRGEPLRAIRPPGLLGSSGPNNRCPCPGWVG